MISLAKTPTKPRQRNASRKHDECSRKRTLLKERIRALEGRLAEVESEYSLSNIRHDQISEVLAILVEKAGIKALLDPFGASAQHSDEKGKSNDHPPS